MTRHGGGVFRRLLHVVEADSRSIEFEGVAELWIASCGAACVVLGETDTAGRTPCTECFPTKGDDKCARPASAVTAAASSTTTTPRASPARSVAAAARGNTPLDQPRQESQAMGSCDWCGGSGTWTDPETGEQKPCIKCGGSGKK